MPGMTKRPFVPAGLLVLLLCSASCSHLSKPSTSWSPETGVSDAVAVELEKFHPVDPPRGSSLLLRQGDRLAICGDSITEQTMYSRIMETYLAVCVPQWEVTVRQYGWSGEKADGFLRRMTNDVLRFNPTVATTCYGMNDHRYTPYTDEIGKRYRDYSTAIVESFKAHGVRVVQGSPGCVGKVPGWGDKTATVDQLNQNLCLLRNIGVEIAREQNVRFADVFWPMLAASYAGREAHGADYDVAGDDGVHPGWAGQVVMAYAFLDALGLDGEIGRYDVNLASGKATASEGHEVVSFSGGVLQVRSSRYPFCATGDPGSDGSMRSGMALVPFNDRLNRLTLRVKGKAASYMVIWGGESKVFSAEQLKDGINLADLYPVNPFSDAFNKVDAAVLRKQQYETDQIKKAFRSGEAKTDMEAVARETEAVRAPLAAAIGEAFVPVTHEIRIEEM